MLFLEPAMLVRCVCRCYSSGRKWKGQWVDKLRIYARGGTGGQGSQRLGGCGGKGGDVLVSACEGASLTALSRLTSQRFMAGNGEHSSSSRVFGSNGGSVTIRVPPGTVVWNENGKQVTDLDEIGSCHVLARGGTGGSHITTNYQGRKGARGVFTLELKLIAEVGMVGFPNAGKSTLLSTLSRATPTIASYPFTTIRPQLGILSHDTDRPIRIADLPGLVEGAHANVGMGHKFLRHIERTRLLLFVVDIGGFQLSSKHPERNAGETIQLLVDELEAYQNGLSHRPAILAINKMDEDGAREKLEQLMRHISSSVSEMEFQGIVPVSALNRTGIDDLKAMLANILLTRHNDNLNVMIYHMT